jgi:hypothetical protein
MSHVFPFCGMFSHKFCETIVFLLFFLLMYMSSLHLKEVTCLNFEWNYT